MEGAAVPAQSLYRPVVFSAERSGRIRAESADGQAGLGRDDGKGRGLFLSHEHQRPVRDGGLAVLRGQQLFRRGK